MGIIDNAYHYLNTKFCQPAVWFDSFFVDDRVTQDARAGTMVRWYHDYTVSEAGEYQYQTYLKAKVHLPFASEKLKLIFESDVEEDVLELFPEQEDELEASLGLRYDWYAREKSSFNLKVSAAPSIEMRYRYSYSFSPDTLLRFTQRVYQRKGVTGETSQIDIDYTLNPYFLLRWANIAKYDSELEGFELGSGITLYQSLSNKRALNYKASITGYDQPDEYLGNIHLSLTYRQNIYRSWLFYELTPAYDWNKDYSLKREGEGSVTLRLEFLFNNV